MAIGIMPYHEIDVPKATAPWANALKSALSAYSAGQDIQGKGYENLINKAKAQYAQPMAAAELNKAQAEPDFMRAQTTYQNALSQGVPSEIALRNAQTNAIPSEVAMRNAQTANASQDALKQKILNQFLPQREQAEIGETKARGNYYNMGGGSTSTGTRDQNIYQNMVANDNPGLSPEETRNAANILASGGTQMPDGRQINMSALTRMQLDRTLKSTTTSALLTKGVQANQAEKEINVLNDYAQRGIQGYGTTYLNKSPQQIYDSLKDDKKSQTKLGRLIAARQLQFEIAQNEIKLANGQPGVTQTGELMDLGQQMINTNFPRLSAEARSEANKYFIEALKEGLKARNKLGIGATAATGGAAESRPNKIVKWKMVNGQLQRAE